MNKMHLVIIRVSEKELNRLKFVGVTERLLLIFMLKNRKKSILATSLSERCLITRIKVLFICHGN